MSPLPHHVAPLSILPPEKQAEIATAVATAVPPPRYLRSPLFEMESRAWWEWHWQRGIFPGTRRAKIPPALRARVIARDGYTCQLCGGDVDPADVHLDHIHPRSRGGKETLANLQVTHSLCNIKKGARL